MKPAVARKIIFLQQYDFNIVHKDGVKIPHADALSRCKPADEENIVSEDIEHVLNVIDSDGKVKNVGTFLGLAELTLENVKLGQKEDVYYKAMYDYIERNVVPADNTLKK